MFEEKLEVYLSAQPRKDDEKRKIRKAVKDFMLLLREQGRAWPEEADYKAYERAMQADDKSAGTIRDNVSRIRKFFASVSSEAEGVNLPDESSESSVPSAQASVRNEESTGSDQLASRRFSLLLPPDMYSSLEWLSQYDKCSVARVIIQACTEYISARQDDINFFREVMAKLTADIERRKSERV